MYLTPDKLRHITASAKKVGIDLSAYIRHRCLNEDPKQELINRNLAQLLCNLANTVQELDGNEELCERLSSLEEQLWQSIGESTSQKNNQISSY